MAIRTTSVATVVDEILSLRSRISVERSVLVAVTGIDASGKGYVAARIVDGLKERGVRVVGLAADDWLAEPPTRQNDTQRPDSAQRFYRHAVRFDEMFERLVLPLRDRRSVRLEVDLAADTPSGSRRGRYELEDVDVVVLEGIYLLKRELRHAYDLSIWVDCSFEAALERAILRGQEGLPPAETVAAYQTTYFPAQEIHLERDDPRGAATIILDNDSGSA